MSRVRMRSSAGFLHTSQRKQHADGKKQPHLHQLKRCDPAIEQEFGRGAGHRPEQSGHNHIEVTTPGDGCGGRCRHACTVGLPIWSKLS